jgi:hypothetical protein
MQSYIITETIKSAMANKPLRFVLSAMLLALFLVLRSGAQDMNKPATSQTSVDEQCIVNLRIIYKLLELHLHHSAGAMGFPHNLDLLYGMSKDPNDFICPADKQINTSVRTKTFRTSYEVVNDPLKPDSSTTLIGRIAIIAEKRANHNGKRFVLFYDGSVRAFDLTQFGKLKGNSFIDAEGVETKH